MFSDIICEQLVKRKIGPKQLLIGSVVLVVGLFFSFLLRALGIVVDHTLGMMGVLFFLLGFALTLFCLRYVMMVEYEYSFVNGELTIDRIIAKSRRKHMIDVNVKFFEKIGKYDPETVNKLKVDVVRDYSVDKLDQDTVYAYFKDGNGSRKTLLIFSPNEKFIGAMKPYVNNMVFREAFPNFKSAEKSEAK